MCEHLTTVTIRYRLSGVSRGSPETQTVKCLRVESRNMCTLLGVGMQHCKCTAAQLHRLTRLKAWDVSGVQLDSPCIKLTSLTGYCLVCSCCFFLLRCIIHVTSIPGASSSLCMRVCLFAGETGMLLTPAWKPRYAGKQFCG